jgi:YVTN family beta-propeller protein
MIEADSMLYVAVNNSNAIHGINRNTLMHSWSATVEQPRYLASDGNHLFVSNWKDSSIYVLDKTNGSLVDSIDMGTLHGAIDHF